LANLAPEGLKTACKGGKCNYFYETEKVTKTFLPKDSEKKRFCVTSDKLNGLPPLFSLSLFICEKRTHAPTHTQTQRLSIGRHVVECGVFISAVRGMCKYNTD
jgi:hypothetical protein